MEIIDAAIGSIIRKVVEEMADIVNQCCDDKGGTGPGAFCQACGLTGMFPLGNRFAAVFRMAMFGEEEAERVVGVGHEPGERS